MPTTRLRPGLALLIGAMITTMAMTIAAKPALAGSCNAEIGRREAARLVERCLEVSPATRPPCNAANACAIIESEIARGCRIVADDAPGWCAEYR